MILDTSFVLAVTERHHPSAIDSLFGLGQPGQRSMFVLGEIQRRVDAPAEPLRRLQRLRTKNAYLELTQWFDPDHYSFVAVADAYALISTTATEHGVRIGQNDRWIVAEALATSTQVLTCDRTMHALGELFGGTEASPTVLVETAFDL